MLRLIGLILLSDKIIPALFLGTVYSRLLLLWWLFWNASVVLARVNAHQNSYRNTASDGALIFNGEVIAAEMAHYVEGSWAMIERVGERLRRCEKIGAKALFIDTYVAVA